MIQGFYTAKSALVQKQKGINTIANNIANVNTKGFKKNQTSFKEALYYQQSKRFTPNISTNYQVGSGTYISNNEKDFAQGMIIETKEALDLALDGLGFFTLKDQTAKLHYTRGGSFAYAPSETANMKVIVNDLGYCLADTHGDPILIPEAVDALMIDAKGNLYYEGQEQTQDLMIINFASCGQLEAEKGGMYLQTELSGEPFEASNVQIKQGFLENSNVDTAQEMVELIQAQRVFEINSKVMQTIDEMQAQTNRLRK